MKIDAQLPQEIKQKYEIVRTDDYSVVPGEIVCADPDTGECSIYRDGETKQLSFGVGGIQVVLKTRSAVGS